MSRPVLSPDQKCVEPAASVLKPMSGDLISFSSEDNFEPFRGHFLVPANWTSCGMVVHVTGGRDLKDGQPVALALTRVMLSLCTHTGPLVDVPLQSIRGVQVVDLTGMAIPIRTPSGIVEMVPDVAKGVAIKYQLNPLKTQIEVTVYTLAPKAAFEWVNVIQHAINDASSDMWNAGKIFHR